MSLLRCDVIYKSASLVIVSIVERIERIDMIYLLKMNSVN